MSIDLSNIAEERITAMQSTVPPFKMLLPPIMALMKLPMPTNIALLKLSISCVISRLWRISCSKPAC